MIIKLENNARSKSILLIILCFLNFKKEKKLCVKKIKALKIHCKLMHSIFEIIKNRKIIQFSNRLYNR